MPPLPETLINTGGSNLASADLTNSNEETEAVMITTTHEASAYPPPPPDIWNEPQTHEEPIQDVPMEPVKAEQPIESMVLAQPTSSVEQVIFDYFSNTYSCSFI
jgi:hypothetical protein